MKRKRKFTKEDKGKNFVVNSMGEIKPIVQTGFGLVHDIRDLEDYLEDKKMRSETIDEYLA